MQLTGPATVNNSKSPITPQEKLRGIIGARLQPTGSATPESSQSCEHSNCPTNERRKPSPLFGATENIKSVDSSTFVSRCQRSTHDKVLWPQKIKVDFQAKFTALTTLKQLTEAAEEQTLSSYPASRKASPPREARPVAAAALPRQRVNLGKQILANVIINKNRCAQMSSKPAGASVKRLQILQSPQASLQYAAGVCSKGQGKPGAASLTA